MATMIQITGQGTTRQTEEAYSYKIEGYVTKTMEAITEFKGVMQYAKDAKKTPVYGTIANGKLCFVEARKNRISGGLVSLIHDITFYKENNGLGTTMAINDKAIYSEMPYPVSVESVSVSKKHLQDEEYISNLKLEIDNLEA